jgi:hypothetical protein
LRKQKANFEIQLNKISKLNSFKMPKTMLTLILLLCAFALKAQRGIVQGTLNDEEGLPLPGVTILVKGTTKAAVTDLNGMYRIECNVGDVLVFSFIGMNTRERKVDVGMFANVLSPVSDEKIKLVPVQPIRTKAYSENIKESAFKPDSAMVQTSRYNWRIRNTKGNYFYNLKFRSVREKDTEIVFRPAAEPVFYVIEFNSYLSLKSIYNMPLLQNQFAQGRPFQGINMWFGPESNETFAWGPPLSNLVYDGIGYPFDPNGRLIPKNPLNLPPAQAYNPYHIFGRGIVMKNSVKLSGKWEQSQADLSFTHRSETGNLAAIDILSDAFSMDYKLTAGCHQVKTGLNYLSEKDQFANLDGLWQKTMQAIMSTPPGFDNSQGYSVSSQMQRSSAPMLRNNPYFLMNTSKSDENSTSASAFLWYTISLPSTKLGFTADYSKSNYMGFHAVSPGTIGFPDFFSKREYLVFSDWKLQVLAENHTINFASFKTATVINFENLDYSGTENELADISRELGRNDINWFQEITLKPSGGGLIYNSVFTIKNTVYAAPGRSKWFLPTLGCNLSFDDLLHLDYINVNQLEFLVNYTHSVAELPLYMKDRSYSTLAYDLGQMDGFLERQELFFSKDLDLETRQSFHVGILAGGYRLLDVLNYKIDLQYTHQMARNSIFPVQTNKGFELANVAKIQSKSFNLSLQFKMVQNHATTWEGRIVGSKTKTMVKELRQGFENLPIAGFGNFSKNLISGQPVGVFVGSVYKRTVGGELIIGIDGFPMVANEKQIVGDPNPDFYLAFENKLTLFKGLTLSLLIDCQKGGDIWNGTGNFLSYHGLSQKTANDRQITNYIFPGVTESGEVNSIPVDFANPANGLEGNRWYKYGPAGVAEDAMEDGSWFRIKELVLNWQAINSRNKFIRNLGFKLYAGNIWIKTKYTGASPLSWFNDYPQGQGIDFFNMPATREFGFGLTLKI